MFDVISFAKAFGSVISFFIAYRTAQSMFCKNKEFEERLELAFERGNLSVKLDNKTKLSPKLLSKEETPYGWSMKYYLPIGLTIDEVDRAKKIIEGATKSEIEAWIDGQELNIEFYTKSIPKLIHYNEEFEQRGKEEIPLGIALGYGRRGIETINFKDYYHISIGGMTRMGKSNLINIINCQLLQHPFVRFYGIDTKRVEFNVYEEQRNVARIAKDTIKGKQVAREVVKILHERENLLDEKGIKNVHAYNEIFNKEKLTYIFLAIDEYGDFVGDDKFWSDISTIARKGGGFGIYLLLSTQRPSADVLPPVVKSNISLRIALKTSSISNSQIILDAPNAAKLPMIKGRSLVDKEGLRELQVPYISDDQIKLILGRMENETPNNTQLL